MSRIFFSFSNYGFISLGEFMHHIVLVNHIHIWNGTGIECREP